REVALRPLVAGVGLELGVHDARDAILLAEPLDQTPCVEDVPLGSQAERLAPLEEQERVLWSQRRALATPPLDPGPDGEREVAQAAGLPAHVRDEQGVIAGAGLREAGVTAFAPGEGP